MTGTKASTKKGGNLSKDLANLSVPFGLILAQKSLEKYLQSNNPKKETPKKQKEVPKKQKEAPKPKKSLKSKPVKKTIV